MSQKEKNCSITLNYQQVANIIEYVDTLEKERDLQNYEVENCKYQIKKLLSDIDILEELYKGCFGEVVKQEDVISSLRQCYLKHQEEEIKWKADYTSLQHKLKHCYSLLNSSNMMREDLNVIKTQLKDLQTILNMENVSQLPNKSLNISQNQNYFKLKKKFVRLKRHITKQRIKLRNCKARKNQNRQFYNDMRSFIKENLKNPKEIDEKVEMLEKEMVDIKNIVLSLQTSLIQSQSKHNNFPNQYEELMKSNAHIEEQLRCERTTILWLESELQESASKGIEICCESKQLLGNLRNWLLLIKKERRGMMGKIKELRYVNNMLLQKLKEG